MTSLRTTFCGVGVLAIAISAPAKDDSVRLRPPLWVDRDDKPIAEPPERPASELWDLVRNTWLRHLDLGYKGVQGAHRPAMNVNAWDEVPDSSWFTNRIGREPWTGEQLLAGAPGLSPAPGKWAILELKIAGYTPGVHFEDPNGERFVLKFDLPAAPERNSAADRIGSLLMYAAGFNTPHNSIVYFRADDLVLADDAEYEDLLGRKRPMSESDPAGALEALAPGTDGRYRSLASHYIEGVPKGYFPYWGVREDDPNDIIPHELRRELRGLRVIAAWFNHVDTKEVNTFDTFVTTEDGRGYIKHYFIDFGSTMGSGDFQNGPKRVGHEYMFDAPAIFKSLATFGFWQRPWEEECDVIYAEVGHFEARLFDPPKWKPNYPNLAFEEMDDADAYWGAKIVTAFTDDLVEALAEAGRYRQEAITRHVAETLRRRRDAIGLYWLDRVTPLEELELDTTSSPWILRFRDLAVERGYADASSRDYELEVSSVHLERLTRGSSDQVGIVELVPPSDTVEGSTDRWGRTPLWVVDITSNRRDGHRALPTRVILGREEAQPSVRVLGWTHAPR